MEGRLVQLDFSAAFDRVSHCSLLYKLRPTNIGGQLLFIVLEFFSDKRQRVSYDCKVSMSFDAVSGVTQSGVLGPSLSILYTSELFHIIGNHIVGCENDTTIYAALPRPLLRQVMELLKQNLAAINS